MARRTSLTLAVGLVLGLLALGAIWGLVLGLAALLVVIIVAGLAGQLLLGGRLDPEGILVAGAVGALLGLGLVSVTGLPALVRIGGVPIVWATAGAVVVLAALRSAPSSLRR